MSLQSLQNLPYSKPLQIFTQEKKFVTISTE